MYCISFESSMMLFCAFPLSNSIRVWILFSVFIKKCGFSWYFRYFNSAFRRSRSSSFRVSSSWSDFRKSRMAILNPINNTAIKIWVNVMKGGNGEPCMSSLGRAGGGRGINREGWRVMSSKWNNPISSGTMMNNKGMMSITAVMYPAYRFFNNRSGISI